MPRRSLGLGGTDGFDGLGWLDWLDVLGGLDGFQDFDDLERLDGLHDLHCLDGFDGFDGCTVGTRQNESSLPGRRPCRYEPPCGHIFEAHVEGNANTFVQNDRSLRTVRAARVVQPGETFRVCWGAIAV